MEPPRKKFTSRYYGVSGRFNPQTLFEEWIQNFGIVSCSQVSWHKSSQRWAVQIRHDGKRIHVGYFADELEAAIAYDRVSYLLLG